MCSTALCIETGSASVWLQEIVYLGAGHCWQCEDAWLASASRSPARKCAERTFLASSVPALYQSIQIWSILLRGMSAFQIRMHRLVDKLEDETKTSSCNSLPVTAEWAPWHKLMLSCDMESEVHRATLDAARTKPSCTSGRHPSDKASTKITVDLLILR